MIDGRLIVFGESLEGLVMDNLAIQFSSTVSGNIRKRVVEVDWFESLFLEGGGTSRIQVENRFLFLSICKVS